MSEVLIAHAGTTAGASATVGPPREPVLRVVDGSKIYGGVHAIEKVNFDLYPGEVHALVGENGAGKSTLCKAIAGAIKLTSGDYYVDGKPVDFERPRDALAAGICMVYQETSLVPTMTAAQNIELGSEKLITSFKKLNIQAQQLLQSLELSHRSGDAGGDARHRQTPDGRNRARSLQRRPYHYLRRTDGKPDAGRDHPLLQPGTRPARARRRHHLHLPCARGVAADLRPHHGAARRQAGGDRADRGNEPREAGARHGRPRHHPDPLCRPQGRPCRAPQTSGARRCSRSRT